MCERYQHAPQLHAQGGHVVRTDEKTGLQAHERAHPTRPMLPGLVERREFEYIRHGTQTLMANLEVATGNVMAPSISPTRTEEAFVIHLERTIALAPDADWIFMVDQLNTHQSASLVRLVADQCGLATGFGVQGQAGVVESMATRAAF